MAPVHRSGRTQCEASPSPEVVAAISQLALQGDQSQRGAVYTQAWVVEGILDLVDYTRDADLSTRRILEPAFGAGDFLFPLVKRLLDSYLARGGTPARAESELQACVRAIELHLASYQATRARLQAHLVEWGMSEKAATCLVDHWLVQDDFLLTKNDPVYDTVVGNPPYVRQERIPAALLSEYRKRYKTIYDRADLYVPFYERSLDLLSSGGALGFICANRWIKNRYGGPLRAKVTQDFELRYYIDLEGVQAFRDQVYAYPAITVIGKRAPSQGPSVTRAAVDFETSEDGMPALIRAMQGQPAQGKVSICHIEELGQGRDPWLLDKPEQLALIRRLEAQFPTLEAAGCKVGIGVATGADRVYIGQLDELPVEEERKLPLLMASDLVDGEISWRGRGIVNPFLEDGTLASLEDYPRFAAYLEEHRAQVAARHVARKHPAQWYRTIDRVTPSLRGRPKLLIPDIKGAASVVYDPGHYYPHHNLYVLLSDQWDLRALQTLLRSSVALMFVSAYSVKMAGGFLRFQAQYLRRIRIPAWDTLSEEMRCKLVALSQSAHQAAIDSATFELFGLNAKEARLVSEPAQLLAKTRKRAQ